MNSFFLQDIEKITDDKKILWSEFKDTTVLITGSTGLIGKTICHALSNASNKYNLNISIIAVGRNKKKLELLKTEDMVDKIVEWDILNKCPDDLIVNTVDYIIHCAAITQSEKMILSPVDVIDVSVLGTKNVLDVAFKTKCNTFIYLSSMEIYGQTNLIEVREDDIGFLDLTNVRSCYPESKRLCENLCISYMKQYGLPIKIARLAQTFGAGTPKNDTRVFAQFARSAIEQKDIILHTDGSSRGNYCYLSETVAGILYILLEGSNGEIYNVVNPSASCTILEMAKTVANDICHNSILVRFNINDDTSKKYAAKTNYRLNSDKLSSLGWKAEIGLKEMYERLIADWREIY